MSDLKEQSEQAWIEKAWSNYTNDYKQSIYLRGISDYKSRLRETIQKGIEDIDDIGELTEQEKGYRTALTDMLDQIDTLTPSKDRKDETQNN